jgi:hypothetical protein
VAGVLVRLPQTATVDTVLAAASRALELSTPARRVYTILGELVTTAASTAEVAGTQGNTQPWRAAVAGAALFAPPTVFVVSRGEPFVPVDTAMARAARQALQTAVDALGAELDGLRRVGVELQAGVSTETAAAKTCVAAKICTGVVFGASAVRQDRAGASLARNLADFCRSCAEKEGAPETGPWDEGDFACSNATAALSSGSASALVDPNRPLGLKNLFLSS